MFKELVNNAKTFWLVFKIALIVLCVIYIVNGELWRKISGKFNDLKEGFVAFFRRDNISGGSGGGSW